MAISTGGIDTAKIVEVMFENALETYEEQSQMLDMIDVYLPDSGTLQHTGNNTLWRPVEQHAPVKEGWTINDAGGALPNFGNIIEEYYPASLGEPQNDAFQLRADELRDMGFWERRGRKSGEQQATYLNQKLAELVTTTGSLFGSSTTLNGYDFIGEAQTILNERQVASTERTFVLNERDRQKYAGDLAQRGTLSGRPEDSYRTGMIGQEVAQFDVYSGSYLPLVEGAPTPPSNPTVNGDQSFRPEGSTQTAQGVYVNVDYRIAVVPISGLVAGEEFKVGDKIQFENVNAVGLSDKTNTGEGMTFTVVATNGDAVTPATQISIYPKPIALDDPALTPEELAVANVNTGLVNGALIARLNIANARSNIFWAKDSIEIIGGDAPVQLLSELAGQKVISSSLKSGLSMYMAYDGNINDLTFKCRLFTWWGLVNKNPMANGVLLSI